MTTDSWHHLLCYIIDCLYTQCKPWKLYSAYVTCFVLFCFFNSQMNLQYFASALVWFLTRFNPTEPYNIHTSCISYCVIALTNVIVFIIVLKNWHFNDPNLDSELLELSRLIRISSNWYFTCRFIPSLNLKTPEYLCTLFTVWVSIFCTVVVYLKGGFWGEGSWAKGTLAGGAEGLLQLCHEPPEWGDQV